MDNIRLLYIDLFCGAGGTSTGVEKANYKERKCAKVIACVNHDANAIASHAANHPEAQHYTEDMRTLDLRPLAEHTAEMRRMYPMAKVVLWASLECTNFSRAKGGQPRNPGRFRVELLGYGSYRSEGFAFRLLGRCKKEFPPAAGRRRRGLSVLLQSRRIDNRSRFAG